jgi:hypothetical protein
MVMYRECRCSSTWQMVACVIPIVSPLSRSEGFSKISENRYGSSRSVQQESTHCVSCGENAKPTVVAGSQNRMDA